VLAEIHAMVEEWERRAREQGNGQPATSYFPAQNPIT
jgi:hypothetical protein